MQAIERCDVAIFVLDAVDGVTRQDLRIAEEIAQLGRSAVIAVNKIDAVGRDDLRKRLSEITRRLPHLEFAPVFEISALSGRGTDALIPALRPILEARELRVPTHLLNAVVDDLQARTPIPSTGRGRRVKYAVQVEVRPPTIILFGTDKVPDRWRRYLERGLRSRFGFEGTPIRLFTRSESHRTKSRSRSSESRSG